MKKAKQLKIKDLIRYREGEVTRSEMEEIEKRLADNPMDAKRLSKVAKLTEHLREIDSDLEEIDFVPLVREATSKMPREIHKKSHFVSWPLAVGFALTAACLLIVIGISPSPTLTQLLRKDSEFRAKSAGTPDVEREKWCGITPYRLRPGHDPRVLGETMHSGDSLLIAYTNIGEHPFRYLMVFAVDALGTVFWYYPAYTEDVKGDPQGIKILGGRGVGEIELPVSITQELKPGPLVIYGLFTDNALTVSEIERVVSKKLKKDPGFLKRAQRIPLNSSENSAQHVIKTMVIK